MNGLASRFARVRTLVRKEFRQVLRDPSSIAISIVLPLVMIILFGYGLSLDMKNVLVAVVVQDTGHESMDFARAIAGTPEFKATITPSMRDAEKMVRDHDADAIVCLPADFGRKLHAGEGAPTVQVIVNGVDANRARSIQSYIKAILAQWQSRRADRAGQNEQPAGHVAHVELSTRTWFNPINESRYFLVPGLLVMVMTLIGALMTALVVAREWERGTFESLFVTPARSEEILLGKTVPYFTLGMVGLVLCLLASRFLFHVPLQGSMIVLALVSALYLVVSLGLGLLISSATKNQFVASQLALVVTFMPAFMLSGFIYDIRNMPAFVQAASYVVPARYYVALLQTLFMAGDIWKVIIPNTAVLAIAAAVLMGLARAATRKRLA